MLDTVAGALLLAVAGALIAAAALALFLWLVRNHVAVWLEELLEHTYQRRAAIVGIEPSWVDLVAFKGRYGRRLKRKCLSARGATWYFITRDPTGFSTWLAKNSPLVAKAVETRDIDVVWIYVATEPRTEMIEVFRGGRSEPESDTSESGLAQLRVASSRNGARWKIYASSKQQYYMAFLSVPNGPVSKDSAPIGTFGFVQPYLMTSRAYGERPGLYLESLRQRPEASSGPLDLYYRSIIDYVDTGTRRGWFTPENSALPA